MVRRTNTSSYMDRKTINLAEQDEFIIEQYAQAFSAKNVSDVFEIIAKEHICYVNVDVDEVPAVKLQLEITPLAKLVVPTFEQFPVDESEYVTSFA